MQIRRVVTRSMSPKSVLPKRTHGQLVPPTVTCNVNHGYTLKCFIMNTITLDWTIRLISIKAISIHILTFSWVLVGDLPICDIYTMAHLTTQLSHAHVTGSNNCNHSNMSMAKVLDGDHEG